tara:strand:+ start:19391 stop:19537 length:147 start_codon:yes stop_codon:yes gene_type:complete
MSAGLMSDAGVVVAGMGRSFGNQGQCELDALHMGIPDRKENDPHFNAS